MTVVGQKVPQGCNAKAATHKERRCSVLPVRLQDQKEPHPDFVAKHRSRVKQLRESLVSPQFDCESQCLVPDQSQTVFSGVFWNNNAYISSFFAKICPISSKGPLESLTAVSIE